MRIVTQPGRRVLPLLGVAGALIACGSAAKAQEGDLARCLAIADIQARVACYDAIARAQAQVEPGGATAVPEARPVRPSAAAPQAAPAPAVPESDPRAEFGLSPAEREERLPSEQQQLEQVDAVVAAARIVGAGYWEFTMEDGSVWRLAEMRRSFRPPRAGDAVELRRGSLGSYFLEADSQIGIRIKRVN